MLLTSAVASLGTPLIPLVVSTYDVPLHTAQWTLTSPLLLGAIATPVIGRLGGQSRRKPVLLGAVGIVVVGLTLSALPLPFEFLLTGRVLQGLGLAIAPLAIAIARDEVAPPHLQPVTALLSVTALSGAGLGSPFTTLVAGTLGMHAPYAIAAALAAVGLVLVAIAVPRNPKASQAELDWFGASVLGAGVLLALLAIGQSTVLEAPMTLLIGGAAVAMILLWVHRSLRARAAVIDLRLAVRPRVVVAHIVALAGGVGTYLLLPLVMLAAQDPGAANVPLTAAGLLLVPYALLSTISVGAALRMQRRIGTSMVLVLGGATYATACLVLSAWHSSFWVLLLAMTIAGIGSGWTFAVIPQLIIAQVPAEETSSAMSLNMLLRYVGFSVGSSLGPVFIQAALAVGDDSYQLPFLWTSILFAGYAIVLIVLIRRGRRNG